MYNEGDNTNILALNSRVKIIKRNLIQDERGWFLKTMTGFEDNLSQQFGEVYLTMGREGQSKGGHFHPEANEWFTLISGNAVLKLEDVITHERMDIDMSLKNAITVFIPNNVAHVVVNQGKDDFILLAYTDKRYDPNDTISYRIQ